MIRLLVAAALLSLLRIHAYGQSSPAKYVSDLKLPPLPIIKIPQPVRFQLPNGLTVYLLENHDFPTVTGAARIRMGSRWDPPGQVGLAQVAGIAVRSGGTQTIAPDELNSELDQLGAKVEVNVGETSGIAFFYALQENTAKVVHLLADTLRNPALSPKSINLAKKEIAAGVFGIDGSGIRVSQREIRRLIYGKDSVYSRLPTIATLNAITATDVAAFHRQYFQPENIVLGIWGDFKLDEMLALVKRELGSWPRGGHPPPDLPAVDSQIPLANHGVYIVNRPGAPDAIVTLATMGGKRSESSFYPAIVLARILSTRLMSRIRSREGLAYSVYALWAAQFDYPGMCLIRSDAKTEDVLQVIKIMSEELHAVLETGVSEGELQAAKDFILKGSAFDFDTIDKIITRFVDYEYFGYPQDYIQNFQPNIGKVTRQALLSFAHNHLDPEKMILLVVGDLTLSEKSLAAYGPVKILNAP